MSELGLGEVFAGHRIETVIGHGGMGVVYRATQLALDRPVALKVIAPAFAASEEFRARFQRESRLAAQIEHPHVVGVFDAGEHEGTLFVTMRYVEGVDLANLISVHGRLPPQLAARLLAQVASALGAAHARGLVHRDVKPQNVLVGSREGDRHGYLTDFGLAKAAGAETSVTAAGMVLGTVDYIAPEQIESATEVDHRVDIYSLGCVLYHALSGQLPYPGERVTQKLWGHVRAPLPPLPDADPAVPPELEAIVRRAMAKDPAERFQSAADMELALLAVAEESAAGHPTGASRALPEATVAPGPGAGTPTMAEDLPAPGETVVDRGAGAPAPVRWDRHIGADEVLERFRGRTGHGLERCGSDDHWEVLCAPLSFDERGLLSETSRELMGRYGRFRLFVLEPGALDRLLAAEDLPRDADPDGIRWKCESEDPREPDEWIAFRPYGNVVVAWQAASRGGLDETWLRLDSLLRDLAD